MKQAAELPFTLTTKDGYVVNSTIGLGKFLFGGAPESDVVLPDLPQARLFGVVYEDKGKGLKASVMAFEEGVKVNGNAMPLNRFTPVAVPFDLHYDWVHVRFGQGKRLTEQFPLPGILIAASVALVALSFTLMPSTPTKKPLNVAQLQVQQQQQVAFTQAQQELVPQTPSQQASLLAEDLKRRLLSNDLSDKLRVGTQGDKIFVSGTLTQDQSYRWRDVMLAARKKFPAVPITSEVQMARGASELAQQIAAVSLNPAKYVMGKDGTRYSLGDVMPDGWRIENIGSFGLVLSKDGFEETVKF